MCMQLMIGIIIACMQPSHQFVTRYNSHNDAQGPNTITSYLIRRLHELKPKTSFETKEFHTECCPSEERKIHPLGGKSKNGKLLEIYRDYRTFQRFHEISCKQEVLNQPCNWMDHRYRQASRCVQRYNYVYALVKDFNITEHYRLDYIRMKSACSCEVDFTIIKKSVDVGWKLVNGQ